MYVFLDFMHFIIYILVLLFRCGSRILFVMEEEFCARTVSVLTNLNLPA